MGRFTEKQLTIITIVVAVLITGLFAALIVKDVGTIREERAKIDSIRVQIEGADAEIARMESRETEVVVLREIVKRDAAILPDETEINEFVNVLGEFEKASGVVVTQVQGLAKNAQTKGKEAIQKIPMKIRLQGSTEQFLKFMNLLENHDRFVSLPGFAVTKGDERDEKGNFRHEISLELETYSYNPRGGPVARVEVQNYDRRVQELAVQQRISASKPAFIEKYQLKGALNRRDPLADPRVPENSNDPTMNPEERFRKERGLLDQMVLDLQLLKLDVQAEARFRAEHDIIKIPAAAKAVDEKMAEIELAVTNVLQNQLVTIAELKGEFMDRVVKPFEDLKAARSALATEVVVQARQVQEWYVKMKERFDAAAYRDVTMAYDGFRRLVDKRELAPDAVPIEEQMKSLARQAEVIAKFEREPLAIQGVIIDPARKSFAIINGQVLSEGENVDADGKIRIDTIRNDQIHFMYQGVPIVKYLRK